MLALDMLNGKSPHTRNTHSTRLLPPSGVVGVAGVGGKVRLTIIYARDYLPSGAAIGKFKAATEKFKASVGMYRAAIPLQDRKHYQKRTSTPHAVGYFHAHCFSNLTGPKSPEGISSASFS